MYTYIEYRLKRSTNRQKIHNRQSLRLHEETTKHLICTDKNYTRTRAAQGTDKKNAPKPRLRPKIVKLICLDPQTSAESFALKNGCANWFSKVSQFSTSRGQCHRLKARGKTSTW